VQSDTPKEAICSRAAPWVGSLDQMKNWEDPSPFRPEMTGSLIWMLSDLVIVRAFISGREGLRVHGIRVRLVVLVEPI
jgi:hypothetical protein